MSKKARPIEDHESVDEVLSSIRGVLAGEAKKRKLGERVDREANLTRIVDLIGRASELDDTIDANHPIWETLDQRYKGLKSYDRLMEAKATAITGDDLTYKNAPKSNQLSEYPGLQQIPEPSNNVFMDKKSVSSTGLLGDIIPDSDVSLEDLFPESEFSQSDIGTSDKDPVNRKRPSQAERGILKIDRKKISDEKILTEIAKINKILETGEWHGFTKTGNQHTVAGALASGAKKTAKPLSDTDRSVLMSAKSKLQQVLADPSLDIMSFDRVYEGPTVIPGGAQPKESAGGRKPRQYTRQGLLPSGEVAADMSGQPLQQKVVATPATDPRRMGSSRLSKLSEGNVSKYKAPLDIPEFTDPNPPMKAWDRGAPVLIPEGDLKGGGQYGYREYPEAGVKPEPFPAPAPDPMREQMDELTARRQAVGAYPLKPTFGPESYAGSPEAAPMRPTPVSQIGEPIGDRQENLRGLLAQERGLASVGPPDPREPIPMSNPGPSPEELRLQERGLPPVTVDAWRGNQPTNTDIRYGENRIPGMIPGNANIEGSVPTYRPLMQGAGVLPAVEPEAPSPMRPGVLTEAGMSVPTDPTVTSRLEEERRLENRLAAMNDDIMLADDDPRVMKAEAEIENMPKSEKLKAKAKIRKMGGYTAGLVGVILSGSAIAAEATGTKSGKKYAEAVNGLLDTYTENVTQKGYEAMGVDRSDIISEDDSFGAQIRKGILPDTMADVTGLLSYL